MTSVRDILNEAVKDVEETNVPEDLRGIAFSKAFDFRADTLAAPSSGASGVQTGEARTQAGGRGAAMSAGALEGDPIAAIAARIGIDRGTVAEVFTASDGELQLIVPPGRLAKRTATASKEIATLIAGGRQAAGLEEWTSWNRIRAVCSDYKKLDSANFAKSMREMEEVFRFRKGEGEREMLMTLARPGWERFAVEVRRLGGE